MTIEKIEEFIYDIIVQKRIEDETNSCMAFFRFFLFGIEYMNDNLSFLKFNLKGWSKASYVEM